MKTLVCVLFIFLFNNVNQEVLLEGADATKNDLLTLENTDHNLLNEVVLAHINLNRAERNLSPLLLNSSLYHLAQQSQFSLEFRPFKDVKKTQSKINKSLREKLKLTAYKGRLAESVAIQHNAINYKKGEAFFHLKGDKTNKLGLYYGAKKDLKNPQTTVKKIPNYTYDQFAQAMLNTLSSKQKKILYSSTYQDIGLQLNWYYKSLHKRKIPQLKMVAILGGYITAGTRPIQSKQR